MGKESVKGSIVAVRLTEDEAKKLEVHTAGEISQSQIIRILIREFLERPEEEQREFLVDRLFGKTK